MNRSNRTLLIIALLLVVAVIAFVFVDFHLSRNELATNSQAERYAFTVDEPLPQGADLDLYVLAPERLDPALGEQLVEALHGNPYVGNVTLRQEPLHAADAAVLVVRIEEPASFLWTPFYTKTDGNVEVAYASDGEVDWIDIRPVVLESTGEPVPIVRVDATLELDGSAYGLISSPAYTRYLAGEIAGQINDLLQNQLSTASS